MGINNLGMNGNFGVGKAQKLNQTEAARQEDKDGKKTGERPVKTIYHGYDENGNPTSIKIGEGGGHVFLDKDGNVEMLIDERGRTAYKDDNGNWHVNDENGNSMDPDEWE